MKKSFARVFSMLLALIMLLGMGASAETHKITLDVNGPDGLKLDGILTAGYDEDGCEQYSIENSMIGKWLLQSDGADLVFGGDQMGYYTVSAEALSKAVITVVSAIASQQLGEEFGILMNYIASPSYQMDLNAIVTILAGEVNRIASLAQQMGLVVIHQNGDIAISANIEKVYALIAAYLESLAQDTSALNAFANLEIFKALGVPMAETADQLPAVLTDAADQLKAAYAQVKDQMDGGCEIYVSAETGVMTAKYYTTTMVNGEVVYSMVENVTASDDGMKMDIVYNVNGGEIKVISEANAAGLSGEEIANPGIVMDAILFVFNANTMNGLTFDAVLNTMMGYYASAAFDGKVFKLDVTADGETVSLEGKMVETENTQYIEFTGIVSGMSFEARFGMKVVGESTPCLFAEAFVNGEKALDVEARIINSGDEIAVEIMGDSVVIDGVKAVLRAGVVMESEETARFFAEAIVDQPGYKLGLYMPVTFVETDNGASLSASLSMAQGDSAMEIGNATVIYEALEVGPAHMNGERLTSDKLAEMILSLLGGI